MVSLWYIDRPNQPVAAPSSAQPCCLTAFYRTKFMRAGLVSGIVNALFFALEFGKP